MAFVPPAYFGTIPWAQREGDDQGDPDAALLEIRPGELNTLTTALRRIFFQWVGAESWTTWMTLVGDLFATLELGVGSVDLARYISTAEGRVLDALGELVKLPRGSLTDDELYRTALRARGASLFAHGTIPELIEIAVLILGDRVYLTELYPATVILSREDIEPDQFALLLLVLGPLFAAGVAALLETWDPTLTAGWGSTTDPGGTEIPIAGAWSTTTGTDADGPYALWSDAQPIV